MKIQSVYRGFQTRKKFQKSYTLDMVMAVVKIQRAYRRYKKRKIEEGLPNLRDPEVKAATVKIQSVYRGFQTRKKFQKSYALDTVMAVVKIQRAYRRYRKKKIEEGLPNLRDPEVKKATVKIQCAFRGFRTRKEINQGGIVSGKVLGAQSKIKVDERDFKRKSKKFNPSVIDNSLVGKGSEELLVHPGDVIAAAITIQRFFRRLHQQAQERKAKEAMARAQSSD